MTVSIDNVASRQYSLVEFQYEPESMFAHPDDTSEIDLLDDPTKEIAAQLFAVGPVVRGHGLTAANGASYVRFADTTFHNIMTPPSYCEQDPFCAVSWEAVRTVYMNSHIFSSTVFEPMVGGFWGPALSPMDPPEHTKYRAVMQRGFTPKRIKSYEDKIIRPIITKWFDAVKSRGKADMVREVNALYPFEIVGTIVGFDPDKIGFVGACFKRMWQANTDPTGAMAASQALKNYSKSLIDSHRGQAPKDNLVSAMMEAEIDGAPLPEDRFVAMINHFMAGGIDTTFNQSGIILQLLLKHPDQFELLRKDRSLIPNAVDESQRYENIGNVVCRQALEDTELCGIHIPKNSVIFLMHAVTNRDPMRWENPDVFDIRRQPQPHVSFGNGPHSCIGQHLARFMLARYIEHLIDDLPNLRWDPALDSPPKITGWTQRGPLKLPVVWDV